jgi:tRNA A-37 threonylcarbamoyl transferase component Bud32
MREIQDLFGKVERYKTVVLQRCFPSKKNTVTYVTLDGQPRVLKWFVPGLKQNMENEYTILKKGCSTLSIPHPYEKDAENNVLVLSYIPGENIYDVISDPQRRLEEKQDIIRRLADWVVHFHTFFRTETGFRLRGDATLRNFILNKGQIWGVDFEESRIGSPVEDPATLCVSLLTTDPMFTDEKFQLCQDFLDAYRKAAAWSIENVAAEISYAMLERIQWRPQDEKVLRSYAAKIRSKGLHVARHNH